MVRLLKLKTLQRKEFADFCQPEIYYSCSTIWYLMRIWQADCYFFFTWQIEKCDFLICILITPSLISFPCTFLVIWIWRVNTLWLSLLALLLKMAKKNYISLHFSDSPAICRHLNKTLFLPAEEPGKGFRWEVRLLGSATTTAPWHPTFSISLQISQNRSYFMLYFMLRALPLSNRLIVLLECWIP